MIRNPEFCGIGETFTKYESEHEYFIKVIANVHFTLRKLPVKEKYIFDKILHPHLLVNQEILNDDIYLIFLIREPKGSISSMLKLFPDWTDERAYHYYTKRLLNLQQYAELKEDKRKKMFITYEQLCGNDNPVIFQIFQ